MSKIINVLPSAWRVRPELLANALFHGVKKENATQQASPLSISKPDAAVACFFGAVEFTRVGLRSSQTEYVGHTIT